MVQEDLSWPLNSEVLHGMPFEQCIINLEKDINDKYKHLENNITERTVYISEKDIEIFYDIHGDDDIYKMIKKCLGKHYTPN